MAEYNQPMMNQSKVAEFFGYLFYVRDVAHLTHLYQPDRTLATHLALKELYEGIVDTADAIIESWQGMNGLVYVEIQKSAPTNTPISFLKEAYSYIEQNRSIFPSSHIQNELDVVCMLLSSVLYKLQYVQ